MEDFDPTSYGPDVVRALSLDGNGQRLMALTCVRSSSSKAFQVLQAWRPAEAFAGARDPEAAMAGLWAYFSGFEEAHRLVSESESKECELWHAILHRQEPDSGNAAYWFRTVGTHPVYPAVAKSAVSILEKYPDADFRAVEWGPLAFVAFCDRARSQPGSIQEKAALEIQRAEWQLLFDYCARPR